MLRIRRVNMDSSWQIEWAGHGIVLDPWLVGSEIDGFSWFNEQWHTTEPVSIGALGSYQTIIVSQPYSDHCHSKTVAEMHGYDRLLAVKAAKKRLSKELPRLRIEEIPDAQQGWMECGGLEIAKLTPEKLIDPIYHAVLIRKGEEAICYAPHGFGLTKSQMKAIEGLNIKLLMTTYAYYKIPAILGGIVNPGVEAAMQLADQIKAAHIVNTHDEQKRGKGLISKIAKTLYTPASVVKAKDSRVLVMEDYAWMEVV